MSRVFYRLNYGTALPDAWRVACRLSRAGGCFVERPVRDWWDMPDSNRRPLDPKSSALPSALIPRIGGTGWTRTTIDQPAPTG